MKRLCRFFAMLFMTLAFNQILFAQGEDEVFNRSVDKVPGVPPPRPGTPDGGYRAAFYKKKAEADAKKKLAEQQRAAQQNPQPKAKKKIAAAKQFAGQSPVYQNPPKAAKKIGDAQKFAIQQQKLPPAAVPRAQQKIKAAQQFADQIDEIEQAEVRAREYRQKQDEAERNRILNLQRKLFLREELTERDRADLIVFGITDPNDQRVSAQPTPISSPSVPRPPSRRSQIIDKDRDREVADVAEQLRREVGALDKAVAVANRGDNQSSDQQNYVQPTPPLAPAPQRPRRAKRVPVPEKPRELDPESREIQRRMINFERDWQGRSDDLFYINAPSRITDEVMALHLNDQSEETY